MEASQKRLLGATVLAFTLIAGLGASPAVAASDSVTVVTVKGHVTDKAGDPIAGVDVFSGCACDFEDGIVPKYASDSDTTSATGLYSLKVNKKYANYVTFTDSKDRYLSATEDDITTKKSGTVYLTDAVLTLASELAGTVVDEAGAPVKNIPVRVFVASTGKEVVVRNSLTNKHGRFHALVPAGDYKIKFNGPSFSYTSAWYGGAASKAEAPIVTVAEGGKTAGLNGAIATKLSIAGAITIDGKDPLSSTKETIVATLLNAAGTVIDRMETVNNFAFTDLTPGTYTVQFRPGDTGAEFFSPLDLPVVVSAGSVVEGLKVNLASTPATSSDKRSAGISLTYSKDTAVKGKAFRTSVAVTSYGNVTGATLTFYAHGKVIATRVVPESGIVSWSTRFSTVATGPVNIWVKYSGTDTTRASKVKAATFVITKK
jgi:5-hydroxyisourate hydrolase-like protein (transthyretin family)